MENDNLKLGEYEFKSRFILGSGKFNPELIKACVDEAGVEIITLALRRVNESQNKISLILSLKILLFYQIQVELEMQMKL